MIDNQEKSLCGIKEIHEWLHFNFGWCRRTVRRKIKSWEQEGNGLIFKAIIGGRLKKCMWPSLFKAYTLKKSSKGEKI